ncbi:MAG TPA: ribonuclease P protein component [Candidatus Absconditabacterales bacterium]|nr:ribonuclease P protein component [Candidatus Absconditabacterales bacterium]
MIGKKYRLTTKEVNFLLKKRQIQSGSDVLFFWFGQYSNRSYNQFGIQLSTKVHKHATKRNTLKRMRYNAIKIGGLLTTTLEQGTLGFKKIMILPHKTSIETWNQLLEQKNRGALQTIIDNNLKRFIITKKHISPHEQ